MKAWTKFLTATALLGAWTTPAAAQQEGAARKYPQLRFGFDAVSVWQALEQRNDSGSLPDLTSGMQAAAGNAHIFVALAEGIDVYAEFYLSSKHHLGQLYDREGWVRIDRLPRTWDFLGLNGLFKHIDIKAGHFEVDFGNQHLTRSDNAQVQNNPLIGNYVVDPNTVEAGLEIIGREGAFNWLAGIGNGVTTEDFQPGRRYSLHGKVWVQPADSAFNIAASVYRVDQSGNPTGYPNKGSWSEMFAGNRSGSRYSGVILGGPDAGQLLVGRGQDLTAWQIDGLVSGGAARLSGLYGRVKDADINGSDPGAPEERWSYYGAEARLSMLFDQVYLAGRYSGASTDLYKGTAADASVNRFQAGLGFWLADGMLFKVEYVRQTYSGFTSDFIANPRFSGALIEGSVSF